MRFAAVLSLIALIPIVGASGYMLNPDPPPLTVNEAALSKLKSDGEPVVDYVMVITKGQYAGEVGPAADALQYTDAQLKKNGVLAWKFLERECDTFSTSGKLTTQDDAEYVVHCTQKQVDRQRVLKGVSASAGAPGVPLEG